MSIKENRLEVNKCSGTGLSTSYVFTTKKLLNIQDIRIILSCRATHLVVQRYSKIKSTRCRARENSRTFPEYDSVCIFQIDLLISKVEKFENMLKKISTYVGHFNLTLMGRVKM